MDEAKHEIDGENHVIKGSSSCGSQTLKKHKTLYNPDAHNTIFTQTFPKMIV